MKSYRSVLKTAVIYSVIIAAIFLTLGALSLSVRFCWISMDDSSPMVYLMFLLFFRTSECEESLRWDQLGIQSQVAVTMPDETATVQRTFIFTLVYVGLYGAMLFTALYSLCGIKNTCMGSKSFIVFFVPWILACCGVVVMDVLATVYHAMDTIALFKTDGLIDILEISNVNNDIRNNFDQLSAMTTFLPPFIFVLTTAKIFVFFVMDIVVIVMITKAGWSAATYHEFVDENYQRNISQTNTGFTSSQRSIAESSKSHANGIRAATASPQQQSPNVRYDDPSKESEIPAFNYNEIFNGETRKDEKVQKFIPRPSTLAIAYSERASKNDTTGDRQIDSRMSNYRQSTASPASAAAVVRRAESPQRDYDKEIDEIFENTINSPVQRPKSLDRPWDEDQHVPDKQRQLKVRVLPPVFDIPKRNSSHLKQRPVPPPKPKPERQSMPTWLVDEERRARQRSESQSPSYGVGGGGASRSVERASSSAKDELRNQQPWSYFKARDDVPKNAKRSFVELEDDEDLPPVPVPDYTLHFGQTKRAPIDDSDGDGTFNRYDQRY